MALSELLLQLHGFIGGKLSELERSDNGVGNIVGLFMHELMVHFTGILIHRTAEKCYGDDFFFPYVNKEYARLPYVVGDYKHQKVSGYSGYKAKIADLSILPYGVGGSVPFGYGQHMFVSKALSLIGKVHPPSQAYLPFIDEQTSFLMALIDEICRLYEIPKATEIKENWLYHVAAHTTPEQSVIKQKAVILGTRCNLHNRKLALNYLQQGKEVFGFTHGEMTNTALDEPVFGYSELSYCTTLIDYGKQLGEGEYNIPSIRPIRRVARRSQVISDLYQDGDIVGSNSCDLKVLYIPTLFSGNNLYGPFRGAEDSIYQAWQLQMLHELEKVYPDITVKVHPKGIGGGSGLVKFKQKDWRTVY